MKGKHLFLFRLNYFILITIKLTDFSISFVVYFMISNRTSGVMGEGSDMKARSMKWIHAWGTTSAKIRRDSYYSRNWAAATLWDTQQSTNLKIGRCDNWEVEGEGGAGTASVHQLTSKNQQFTAVEVGVWPYRQRYIQEGHTTINWNMGDEKMNRRMVRWKQMEWGKVVTTLSLILYSI